MKLTLADLLAVEHSAAWNVDQLLRRPFAGVSTDSRTVKEGELFFAIRGETLDGHQFVEAAFRRGAGCAVVDRRAHVHAYRKKPFVVVQDTSRALGGLAHIYRKKFDIPFLAVAGSNGKTTTKEMIAKVLKTRYSVLSTQGNLNNHIGVPKTLFGLNASHEVGVVEIGTNHFGELENLCAILEPTHGLITNIGREHLEFFGNLGGVARAEGELFDAIRSSGTGFVNVDDPRVLLLARGLRRTVAYGFLGGSVRGKLLSVGTDGCAALTVKRRGRRSMRVKLRTPGAHAAANALAASAVGLSFGVPAADIGRALGNFAGAGKRMEVLHLGGLTILNDTYNANPDSVLSALQALHLMKTKGKKIVILADMLELGAASRSEHERIGNILGDMGFENVMTCGRMARYIHQRPGTRAKFHFDRKDALSKRLLDLVSPHDIILVKGSRGMKMEDVVQFLRKRHGGKAG